MRQSLNNLSFLFSLLLPVLLPSWRFFKTVAPSPRIEVARFERGSDGAWVQVQDWQAFRPAPRRLSFGALVAQIFWNPDRNAQLYLVSCAERMIAAQEEGRRCARSFNEISARLSEALWQAPRTGRAPLAAFRFRLIFIWRAGQELRHDVDFTSDLIALDARA
ncbi:hypothetical protein AQS8620_02150 [Aquimixticola soesokkakensis]|uniref:Uncharacterized protein n=1 Tax=Aquimixticola soesokkakensis TaxID=1519096 RepID=A0A1Y5T1P2_9RHOB|nr:hypothetical protein [Aquimixticola soesokkakensis]SLN50102.1 hypothetical protein AQS8620_02150 [Aquimixticola soesokkakensis]